MRLLFFGTGSFGLPALHAVSRGHEIALVVSQPDRPARRGLEIAHTPIHAAAEALGLPNLQTADVNRAGIEELIHAAEAVVVVDFGQKIGEATLNAPRWGCINIHASLLPRYRGAAPINWAIINGEAVTGVTTFRITRGWDAGDVLVQREAPIGELETADELHDRLAALGAEAILETLRRLEEGTARPAPQDSSRATHARKLSKADGTVDWSEPAHVVVRRIHGLWSWPSATCTFESQAGRSERVQLARARVADQESAPAPESPPGSVDERGWVQAGRGRVELLEVKPAGGRLMSYADFARGRRVQSGDRWRALDQPA